VVFLSPVRLTTRPPIHGEGQASSLVGRLARLGCTRIGSPGIFEVQTHETPCSPAKTQVAAERESAGCRANAGCVVRQPWK
jgi:hypothetical protein